MRKGDENIAAKTPVGFLSSNKDSWLQLFLNKYLFSVVYSLPGKVTIIAIVIVGIVLGSVGIVRPRPRRSTKTLHACMPCGAGRVCRACRPQSAPGIGTRKNACVIDICSRGSSVTSARSLFLPACATVAASGPRAPPPPKAASGGRAAAM